MGNYLSEEELNEVGLKNYGSNVLISRKASIYQASSIVLGSNVRIDDFCILSGNIIMGNYIHIAPYSAFFGGKTGIVMEDFVGISSRVVVYSESDDYSGESLTSPMIPMEYKNVYGGKVTIKRHSILGAGVTVLPDVTIGEGCSIGSMSLVNKSLQEWGIYAGIPCRKLKDRKKDLLKLEKKFLESI